MPTTLAYLVVNIGGDWFVRWGSPSRPTKARPVGEGYARKFDAVRGALRRRLRDGRPHARVVVVA